LDVWKLIDAAEEGGFRDGDIAKAETMLLDALAEHEGPPDSVERMHLMRTLASLYGFDDPPRWGEVERIYAEMEVLRLTGYSKLQTGMMLFWQQQHFERAAAKLREAAEEGKEEDDRRTRYQALSNLGHALLD